MKKKTTAERLIELMNYFDIKQNDLCQRTGIPKSAISMYVSGQRNPRQDRLSAIAEAYGVSEAWLMGFDVPMEKEAYDRHWDKEATEFEDKINAFYYQLKSIGWTYKWIDTENLYLFTNGKTSVRVTAEEYSNMVEQSQEFCRKQLQRIILKSGSLLDAAHARTDIEVTEEMNQHDDDIMDDENF